MISSKYCTYQKYVDSEDSWISQVPENWETSYLGFECSVKARLGWKGLKAEEYVESGYIFLATPNISGSSIDFENVNYITKDRYFESPEIMLKTGDVLVTKDGSTTGTANIVKHLPAPSTVNSSIAVVRSFGAIEPKYLYYYFVSDYTQNIINRMRGGMGVPHLFQEDLRKFRILIPPKIDQKRISVFLDHETARIDKLIEKQQELIKLLKEKRQAVISHAVTKGLNPNARMKDSGVEWLGEVPEHWTVGKLKRYTSVQGGFAFSSELLGDQGVPVIRIGDIGFGGNVTLENCKRVANFGIGKLSQYLIKSGDLLMAMTGATIGKAGWYKDVEVALLNQRVGKFVVDSRKVDVRYLNYLLNSYGYQEYITLTAFGGAQPNISDAGMVGFDSVLPPLFEQLEICKYLDEICSKLVSLILKADLAIELMTERRAAVISAAVTGKIDVRDWKPENNNQLQGQS